MAAPRLVDLRATLKTLAAPLLWMLISSIASIALVWHGWQQNQLAEAGRVAALQTLRQTRGQLEFRLQQEQDMADFSSAYLMLSKQHRFSPDQRLDWRDAMERLRANRLVPQLSYRIFPHTAATAASPSERQTGYSEMKLHLSLGHEEQLLDFFIALRTEMAGWFELESCTLQRDASNQTGARLRAECNGRWITLDAESAS